MINTIPHPIYCEASNSLSSISEPINVFSNLLFIIVAYFGYKVINSHKNISKIFYILPVLLVAIGIGSFSYHLSKNTYTLLADAVPIYIFILFSLYITLSSLITKKLLILSILFVFICIQILTIFYIPKEILNGSIRHLITLTFISTIGFYIIRHEPKKLFKPFLILVSLYIIAIIFRSIDNQLCNIIPIGTHFAWHIFTALAGYQTIKFLLLIRSK